MVVAWLRRQRPPAEALRPLDDDERVTAWAELASGGVAVATVRGLWLPAPVSGSDNGVPGRLAWHLVVKATWQPPTLSLVEAVEGAELDGARVLHERPARTVRLGAPRDLPGQVRERVTRSVRHTEHHELAPSGGVRVAARRVTGRDGLAWQLRFDAGTDPDDPLLREQVTRLLAAAREALAPRV
jgi:hypothetical protein